MGAERGPGEGTASLEKAIDVLEAIADSGEGMGHLELADNGGYAINGQPVPKDQLDTQIHAIYDQRPAKLLFIKAGPNRIYQDVIEAMDVARGAGVQIIGFTPREADKGK